MVTSICPSAPSLPPSPPSPPSSPAPPPQQCIVQPGDSQAKTTNADPDPVNEPCFSVSSCRGYNGGSGYLCCVAVGTCDNMVSSNPAYYLGGCRALNYQSNISSTTSTSDLFPTRTEGCVKQGECNLPYLEQMRGWTATGGPLSANPIPDASMNRLLNGSIGNPADGCRALYPTSSTSAGGGYGPGTYLNTQTGMCEVDCTSGRRMAEASFPLDEPPRTSHQVISEFLAADAALAASLTRVDDTILSSLERLSEQLFGQPALA